MSALVDQQGILCSWSKHAVRDDIDALPHHELLHVQYAATSPTHAQQRVLVSVPLPGGCPWMSGRWGWMSTGIHRASDAAHPTVDRARAPAYRATIILARTGRVALDGDERAAQIFLDDANMICVATAEPVEHQVTGLRGPGRKPGSPRTVVVLTDRAGGEPPAGLNMQRIAGDEFTPGHEHGTPRGWVDAEPAPVLRAVAGGFDVADLTGGYLEHFGCCCHASHFDSRLFEMDQRLQAMDQCSRVRGFGRSNRRGGELV